MKFRLVLGLFALSLLSVTAQEDPLSNLLKIKIPTQTGKVTALQEVEIPEHSEDSSKASTITDIKAEFWDTTVYNPYRHTEVEYPFQVNFTDSTYANPVKFKKVVTSRYGWRRGRPHNGIDIDLVTGDSVVSVLDGIVRFARYSSGHGRTVVVRHFNGLESTYAHLSHIAVKANDTLKKGDYLGKGGNTGRSRGSHLHFSLTYKGQFIHPEYLFKFDETNAIRAQEMWVTKRWTRASFHSAYRVSKLELLESKDDALASLVKERKIYVVKRGDTLSRISRRNNTTITSICRTNKIKKNSTLRIGQKLILEI
ncbi:MAG: peptidoglycan DD-metalloendopeptidase family protein [Winogradskyella sp.]